MKNEATVSVIIPVYNVEEYLCECVDSVLKQTYPSYEIILVDDGSTDSSGSLCDSYAQKDDRISVIHKANGGLSSARNAGFEKASGEYVYFLDSDDYIADNTLEGLIEAAERDSSDVVFFDAFSFGEDGFKVGQNYIRKHSYKTDKGTAVFSEMQKNDEFHSAVPLLFIKKELLTHNNISFMDGIFYEDMLFTYQVLCCAARVSQCKESFYHRRYRSNSIMTSKKNPDKFISFTRVYEEVKKFSENIGIADEDFARAYIVRCAFNCFNIYEKLNKKDKNENKEKLREISEDIIKNDAFSSKALRMRCYGKVFWVMYKLIEVPLKKLRR